jgi:GNAT superfamily N-acetyltransferase
MANARPEDRRRSWRAEREGELVGWAFGGLEPFSSQRTAGFAGVVVHPGCRREGIGSALWDVVSSHLDRIGVRRVVAYGEADFDSAGFARARGFTLASTSASSAVDPRTIASPPAPPPGIDIHPASDFAADPEPVFAADSEASRDEPGPVDFSGMTYETWRRHIWDHPDVDHELSVVARCGEVVVGSTFLFADRATGRAANGGTGVIRACRGRGLGLLMKQHSLGRAAAAGIRRVITQNDETNAPMLAINARLGYEPFAVEHAWLLER